MEDGLAIGYDRSETSDISTLVVVRIRGGQVYVVKSVYGEEAERIYKELTEE